MCEIIQRAPVARRCSVAARRRAAARRRWGGGAVAQLVVVFERRLLPGCPARHMAGICGDLDPPHAQGAEPHRAQNSDRAKSARNRRGEISHEVVRRRSAWMTDDIDEHRC